MGAGGHVCVRASVHMCVEGGQIGGCVGGGWGGGIPVPAVSCWATRFFFNSNLNYLILLFDLDSYDIVSS